MNHSSADVSRREFIRAGTAATLSATALSPLAHAAQDPKPTPPSLPRRTLGKTGVPVTILNQGTSMKLTNRLLNTGWDEGIRYLDTADCYENGNSETFIAEWFQKTGRRKDTFLVTKDHPSTPDEWVKMIDKRLAVLQVDQIDLFFLHGLGGGFGRVDATADGVPKSKEWAKAAEQLKKSGKVKFVGYSTHTRMDLRIALLNDAAVGWPDAIMVASNPALVKSNAEFNKALDNCHKAKIGLICMKEMRGLDKIPEIVPEFADMKLTKHAAVLHAVWTDERFSSICSAMNSIKLVKENAGSAKTYKPLTDKQLGMVSDVLDRHQQAFCAGCDGRCAHAAGSAVALGDIARYLSYYEQDGQRDLARRLYRNLPQEQRDWRSADLAAAQKACASNLPFDEILSRADQKLA